MLLLLFATYVFVSGVVEVIAAIAARNQSDHWWLVLLQGEVGIYLAILSYRETYVIPLTPIFYLATWAVVTGVIQLVCGIKLRKEVEGELWYITSGWLASLFGMALLLIPLAGPVAIRRLITLYSIGSGGILLLLRCQVRLLFAGKGSPKGRKDSCRVAENRETTFTSRPASIPIRAPLRTHHAFQGVRIVLIVASREDFSKPHLLFNHGHR